MTVIFSPFIGQVGRIEPYISSDELKFSATASSLDLADLVANGSQAANDRALNELIKRASGKIDAYLFGKLGTLNATSNTENGRYRMDRDGRFKIHPKYTPLLAVSDFQWGQNMGVMTDLALTTSNCWNEEETIIIYPSGSPTSVTFSGTDALAQLVGDYGSGEYYCQYTYVNGYPNTFTTTSTAAGSTSIPVTDPTGIYPGTQINFWDGMNDESVTVASSYVTGSTTVDLESGTLYKHGIGVNFSQMHTNVKQACIHFVISMVKERGQGGGFEISPAGEVVNSTSGKTKGFDDDQMAAFDLLDEFQAISGRL